MVHKLSNPFPGEDQRPQLRAIPPLEGTEEVDSEILACLQPYQETPPPVAYEEVEAKFIQAKSSGQLREIGRGGMGSIFAMPPTGDEKEVFENLLKEAHFVPEHPNEVAMKFLEPRLLKGPKATLYKTAMAIEAGILFALGKARPDMFPRARKVITEDKEATVDIEKFLRSGTASRALKCIKIEMTLLRDRDLQTLLVKKGFESSGQNSTTPEKPTRVNHKEARQIADLFVDLQKVVEDLDEQTIDLLSQAGGPIEIPMDKEVAEMTTEELAKVMAKVDEEIARVKKERGKIDVPDYVLEGPLSINAFLNIAIQLTDALRAAHENGFCVVDIKRGNTYITSTGNVKLVDFGLAREPNKRLPFEQIGHCTGTPEYMAPEGIRNEQANKMTDLYALGATLYSVLENRPAFDGHLKLQDLLRLKECEKYHPLKRTDLPEGLKALIYQLLRTNPDERPQSAKEVLDRLIEINDGVPKWKIILNSVARKISSVLEFFKTRG